MTATTASLDHNMPSPPSNTSSSGRWMAQAMRGLVLLLLVWWIADGVIATLAPRPSLPTPPKLFAGAATPAAASTESTPPTPTARDPHATRSDDQITSGMKALLSAPKSNLADKFIAFDDLKKTTLNYDPPPIFQDDLKALDGQHVRMRGFMTPFDSLTDMRQFMLFPSATGCFFCAPPSPLEVVFVRQLAKDEAQPYIYEPIEIEGTLRLWRDKSEEAAHTMFLYVIDDATVKKLKS